MFRKKSEPHPAAAPVFSQYSKEAILQLELLPGVSATEVTVAFELQCVTVTQQWSKSEEPMVQTVPLPRKVKVEECWWEVDERSSPKVLRVVLVKDVPNEDWPLESQPLPPQSRPVAAALSIAEQPRFGWVFRAHDFCKGYFWQVFEWSPHFQRYWFSYLIFFIYTTISISYLNNVWLSTNVSWSVASFLWQKVFGLISMAAWLSVWSQIIGLIGSRGIVPLPETVEYLSSSTPTTWTWPGVPPTDANLMLHVYLGLISSALFTLNILPSASIFVSLALYTSVRTCGGVFFQLQFDSLLLEASWISVLLYLNPVHYVSYPFSGNGVAARSAVFLFWWLLFRLLFCSGTIKLTSRDKSWANCTALSYHFWSQPLPTWIGYYFYHLIPTDAHVISCWLHFAFELAAPFSFFITPLRVVVGWTTALGLQGMIMLTGNYGFFNILTAALSIFLIDDAWYPSALVSYVQRDAFEAGWMLQIVSMVWIPASVALSCAWVALVLVACLEPLTGLSRGQFPYLPILERVVSGKLDAAPWKALAPSWLFRFMVRSEDESLSIHSAYRLASKFSLVNTYQLFAVMTTSRVEVLIYGSNDSKEWKSFDLWHKPGDNLTRAPTFVPLGHLPRLDWRLWFCQFGRPQPWIHTLCEKLLSGEPTVYDLFRVAPFDPEQPPKYLRVQLYDYRWTTLSELRTTGMYWKRTLKGDFIPGTLAIDPTTGRLVQVGPPPLPPRRYRGAQAPSIPRPALDVCVLEWLQCLGLQHLTPVFEWEEIDAAALLLLEAHDILDGLKGRVRPEEQSLLLEALSAMPDSGVSVAESTPRTLSQQTVDDLRRALIGRPGDPSSGSAGTSAGWREGVKKRFRTLSQSFAEMQNSFAAPIRRMTLEPNSVVTEQACENIFYRLEILATLSAEFAETLEASVGTVLMKTLLAYVKNYALAVWTLESLKGNARFATQFADIAQDECDQPLDRLLLEPIATCLSMASTDVAELAALIPIAEEARSAMESCTEVLAMHEKTRGIERQLVGVPAGHSSLCTFSRRLLYEGPLLYYRNKQKPESCFIFLFDDLLLCANQQADLLFRFREEFLLDALRMNIVRCSDEHGDFGFSISSELPTFYASSLEELSTWTGVLAQLIQSKAARSSVQPPTMPKSRSHTLKELSSRFQDVLGRRAPVSSQEGVSSMGSGSKSPKSPKSPRVLKLSLTSSPKASPRGK